MFMDKEETEEAIKMIRIRIIIAYVDNSWLVSSIGCSYYILLLPLGLADALNHVSLNLKQEAPSLHML